MIQNGSLQFIGYVGHYFTPGPNVSFICVPPIKTYGSNVLPTPNDEYSLLDLYLGFFWLLILYSENLLLNRVVSNSNKTIDGPKYSIKGCTFYGFLAFNIFLLDQSNKKGKVPL